MLKPIIIIFALLRIAFSCIWCYQCNAQSHFCNNSKSDQERSRKSCSLNCPNSIAYNDVEKALKGEFFSSKICGINAVSFLLPDNEASGSACVTFNWINEKGENYTTKACKGKYVSKKNICKYLKEKCTNNGYKFLSCSSCYASYCNIGLPSPQNDEDNDDDDDKNYDASAKDNVFPILTFQFCVLIVLLF